MELSHTFTVPASVDDTWSTFMDLEAVGGCFPGATVTEVTEDGFAGTVKVKLGPIALMYAGSGAFVERDDAAHRAVIEAKGKDKRGNGTAGATVTVSLSDAGDGATRAEVLTDLAITGKPAQFGRGVMQDVSDKLLQQFISCVEDKLGPPAATAAEVPASTDASSAPASSTGESPAARAPGPSAAPAPGPSAAPAPGPSVPHAPGPSAARAPEPATRPDDALDLGRTVLPVLVKSYGKQVALLVVAVVVVVIVWRVLRG